MPKILITGNGFDLNLGLPTSYSDFIGILTYISKSYDLDFHSIYERSSNYENIILRFKPFDFDNEKIIELRELIGDSIWFNFFRKEFEIDTWIDFENKIEYVLKILFSATEHIQERVFSNGSILKAKTEDLYFRDIIFNRNVEIIQVLYRFNLIEIYGENLRFNQEFLIEKYNSYINIDLNGITQFFQIELEKFKKIFNIYFETFVFPFYKNSTTFIDKNFFSKIDKHFTFNYTPTFDKFYNKRNITSFLHGKINSDENKIVLGINEIPKNDLSEKRYFLPFTKYFQKLNNNTDYNFIKELKLNDRNNYFFFFWGHSLDKSDEDYLNEVFDFVNENKSKLKKIIIIYHSENSRSKLLLNILNVRGKKDIQDLMRSKTLVFMNIDSKELKQELNRDISNQNIYV